MDTSDGRHEPTSPSATASPTDREVVSKARLDVEKAYAQVGKGKMQTLMLLSGSFIWLIQAWCFILPIFAVSPPDLEMDSCDPIVSQQHHGGCTISEGDEACGPHAPLWHITHPAQSLAAEWNLTCERRSMRPLVNSVFFTGVLLGNALLGPLPDLLGRVPTLLLCGLLNTVSSAACAVAPSFQLFLAGRFCLGLFGALMTATAWLFTCEFMGPADAARSMCMMSIAWAMGAVMIVPCAMLLVEWRSLIWLHTLLILLSLVPIALARSRGLETPPWLASRAEAERFHHVMAWIAATNGDCSYNPEAVVVPVADAAPLAEAGGSSGPGFKDILCSCPWGLRTFAFCLAFSSCSLGYFGLSLNSKNLGSSVYSSVALSALVEVPGILLAPVLADHPFLGRRFTLPGSLATAGGCCLLAQALSPGLGETLAAMFGKAFTTVAYTVVYVHSAEVYPASVRGFATNLLSTASRFTGIAAPAVVALPPPMPLIVIGLFCLGTSPLLLVLPETLGSRVPEPSGNTAADAGSKVNAKRYGRLDEEGDVEEVEMSQVKIEAS